jgi:transcriptional regulator with XRE-family HTH domain
MSKDFSHWTNDSLDDFQHSVASDFIRFIEDAMESEGVSQSDLAARLSVTEGRVSQILNNPGNLTLRKIIEYARALKRKVAIVGYNDGDADNRMGPVRADIFSECWSISGKPYDFFSLEKHRERQAKTAMQVTVNLTVTTLVAASSPTYEYSRGPFTEVKSVAATT